MPISIVAPVYHGAVTLADCLAALTASTAPGDEGIVVDDGSTDASAAVATVAGVPVVRLPGNSGPAAARNAGAREAGGDVLILSMPTSWSPLTSSSGSGPRSPRSSC